MPEPIRVIPNKIQTYVDQFIWEAEKRGVDVDVSKLSFEFEVGIDGGSAQYSIVGICTRSDKLHLIKIDTLNSLWLLSGDLGKEEVVFHELGHCLLGRLHKDEKFLSDDFASIMRTVGLLQYGDLNNFSSLFIDPSGLLAHRRDYYVEELFNENTPPPCWADSNAVSPYPLTSFEETFIKERSYRRMWLDPDDNLWFYGGEKNYRLAGGRFQEQLPNLNIAAMNNDSQGNLWIAGFQEEEVIIGIYNSGIFEPAFSAKDFPILFSGIDQLLIDGTNKLWVSDNLGNLYAQSEDGFEVISGLGDGRVSSIREGLGNSVYLLKGGMFYIFEDPQNFVHVNDQNSALPTSFFRNLEVDGNGVAWLQQTGGAPYLYQFTPNFEVKKLNFHRINLAEIRINRLATDTNGDLWVATSNGIKKWEGESFSKYCTYNTGLSMLNFSQIAVGVKGNIWAVGIDFESSEPLLILSEAGI